MSHSQIGYGMGVIATIVHNAGYRTKVIDNNTLYRYYRDKDFEKIINSYKPDVLAYNITMHNAYQTYQQILKFKTLFPNLTIIAGGIHMKHCFEEALNNGVDVVVNREGEKVILPLLEHLERDKYRKELELVKGISFIKEDDSFHFADEFPCLENLDEVPIVNYELFNLDDYIKTEIPEPGVFYINGQRGCPFFCRFCSDEVQRADKRMASAEWLFKNVEYLHRKYKVRYLLIADNNITLDKTRLINFCRKIIESRLNISFSCQTTTRFPIDEELIYLMRKAGFVRINFGVERLTSYSLEKINKEQPFKNVHRILALVKKHDIDPSIFMMVGFPFETKKLLQEEKKLFLEITKYTKRLFLSVLAPTPGTCYYDDYPKIKEWYLNEREHLMLRSYFANVMDYHTFHTIERNFYNFSDEIKEAIIDYYYTFKKINHGSFLLKQNRLISLILKLDFLVAKLSQAVFYLSPSVEFFIFNKLKAIRYYLGNYFFSKNIIGAKEKEEKMNDERFNK